MRLEEITPEQALASLERAVALKGADYVYEPPVEGGDCTYTAPDGSPSCLVGYVIADLDPELLPKIRDLEWTENEAGGREASGTVFDPTNFGAYVPEKFDSSVANILASAQNTQDAGGYWGTALEMAKDAVAN